MSPPNLRVFRFATAVAALALLTLFSGYHVGKQMAQRDNARAVEAAGG